MTTQTTGDRTTWRPVLAGFGVGFVLAFLVPALALLLPLFERLEDVLVPARVLLSPWSDAAASWNGLATLLLAGAVNGLVYAVAFAGAAAAANVVRRSSKP
jgi:hypothetical protein